VACRKEVRRSKGAAAAQNRGDCCLLLAVCASRGQSLVSSWFSARAEGSGHRAA
jgi:hypothetical protein